MFWQKVSIGVRAGLVAGVVLGIGVRLAMRAGARGYVLKGADKTEIMSVIRAVARGEALFGPHIAPLNEFLRGARSIAALDDAPYLPRVA